MAKTFREIAEGCVKRGLKVVPLRGKAPFLQDWIRLASSDPERLAQWGLEYPDYNCGAVVEGQDYFVLDVDDVNWFMENCPPEPPNTLTVQTGSGKLHVYFKHSQDTRLLPMKAVMNPKWTQGSVDEPQKFMEFPDQVVAAGSTHPDTRREYKVLKDVPMAVPSKVWLDWLKSLAHVGAASRMLKTNPLKKGWNPEKELTDAGLKFEKSERDGKIYFNYHAAHGKCLVKGESHAAHGETPNPRQSAFVYNPSNGEFWHQCFSGGCQVPGKTKVALEALGIRWEDTVAPAWRELFESYDDFKNAPELKWIVDGLAHEESMNMVGGLSGNGKTWVMMSIAKALATGSKLWKTFQTSEAPNGVLYLIPEVGRRSWWKRVVLMQMEEMLEQERIIVRTMSMGPTVPLTDRRILQAAKGRDVVLDTAIRFLEGTENDSNDNNLASSGFALLNAGARSWWGIHHSPKSFGKETSMSLEGVLRGTGDFGAMLSTCYGIRQLDSDRNLIQVECVKGRDLDEMPKPFQLEGRPWIEQEGDWRMVKPPGECGFLSDELEAFTGAKGGRPSSVDLEELVKDKKAGMSLTEMAKKHGISKGAVSKALYRAKQNQTDQEDFGGDF